MEWITVEDRLPDRDGKYQVEDSDGDIFFCYFYLDKMIWISFYGQKPCHWWNTKTLQPEFRVIQWKKPQ
jgi:hypothetical protein